MKLTFWEHFSHQPSSFNYCLTRIAYFLSLLPFLFCPFLGRTYKEDSNSPTVVTTDKRWGQQLTFGVLRHTWCSVNELENQDSSSLSDSWQVFCA